MEEGDPVTLNEGNSWKYIWENLDEKSDGEVVSYSAEEVGTVTGYTTSDPVVNEETKTTTITNTHTTETTKITVEKIWDDSSNQDGMRKETTIHLLANGSEYKNQTVSTEDGWSYTFEGLPKYEAGEEITYSITEDQVEGYNEPVITESTLEDGTKCYTVTNTHTPELISLFSGTKIWVDGDDQDGIRPESITVNLLADGEKMQPERSQMVMKPP